MTLRSVDEGDADSLAGLMTQLGYRSTAADMVARLRALGQSPDYHTIVAEADGEVVGVVGMAVGRYYERNGLYGRILALVVAERARGKGIGYALLQAAEAWLRDQGAQAIHITSGHHREATHRFYRRCGYSETGVRFVKEPRT